MFHIVDYIQAYMTFSEKNGLVSYKAGVILKHYKLKYI